MIRGSELRATTTSGRCPPVDAAATVRVRFGSGQRNRAKGVSFRGGTGRPGVRCAASKVVSAAPPPPINLTEKALGHLKKLKIERNDETVLLRIGVRSGGCSGMSYHMDFETEDNIGDADSVIEYDKGQFRMVCDPKSLLYLFGMQLDYSDALIGGGFQFHNPNAADTCGCGKSFGV